MKFELGFSTENSVSRSIRRLMCEKYDVVVIGAGLSGLTISYQLLKQNPSLRILILERRELPYPEAAHKVGESTVELAAHYLAETLELRSYLEERHLPKLGLRFFFGRNGQARFDERLELGSSSYWPTPSYQIDRGRFENDLCEMLAAKGVTIHSGARVQGVSLGDGKSLHEVCYRRGGSSRKVQGVWVLDGSGRAGVLRKQLKSHRALPHRVSAAWFRVDAELNIDNWIDEPRFVIDKDQKISRQYSTNHLMGQGYWVWVIPLSSGATSVGIVAAEEQHPFREIQSFELALRWLQRWEPRCFQAVNQQRRAVLDFMVMRYFAHGCEEVLSSNKYALLGEAGVFLDPFYSPGSDFIAMSNTFVSDLIERHFQGEDVGQRARLYNDLFLSFFENTRQVYEGQYRLFGNSEVMPLKIIWDFSFYWSFFAPWFMNGKLCELSSFREAVAPIQRMDVLNRQAQRWFLKQASSEMGNGAGVRFFDFAAQRSLYRLNSDLRSVSWKQEPVLELEARAEMLAQLLGAVERERGFSQCVERGMF